MRPRTISTCKLKIGDVVVSERFAYGQYDSKGRRKPPQVGLSGPNTTWKFTKPRGKLWTGNMEPANPPHRNKPYYESLQFDGSDETRKTAQFVVITINGQHQSGRNCNPAGSKVFLQRLNSDGTFNPDGEIVFFYACDGFISNIKQVRIVGRMTQTFVLAQ